MSRVVNLSIKCALDEARKSAGFLLFAYVIMIDHMHLLTSRPTTTSDVLRVLKVSDMLWLVVSCHEDFCESQRQAKAYRTPKENNYLSSLSKLEHQEQNRNHRYSLWQTERMFFPFLVKECLWRR